MTLLTLSILNLLTIALIISLPVVAFFGIRHATRPVTPYVADTNFDVVDRSFLGQPRFVVVGRQSGLVVSLPTSSRRRAKQTAINLGRRVAVLGHL